VANPQIRPIKSPCKNETQKFILSGVPVIFMTKTIDFKRTGINGMEIVYHWTINLQESSGFNPKS